jgi:hypothetical protein
MLQKPEKVLASTMRIDPEHSRPDESRPTGQHLFNRTLPNIRNTCFFSSELQVVASIPSFVAEIAKESLSPDHAECSCCLAFLKLSQTPVTCLNTSLDRPRGRTNVRY